MSRAPNRLRLLLVNSMVLICALIPLTACGILVTTQTPEPTATPVPNSTNATESEPTTTALIDDLMISRTPAPTATPGPLQQAVITRLAKAGLSRTQVLGITLSDWINLLTSLIYVVIGYMIGTWAIRVGYRRAVKWAPADLDHERLLKIGPDLRRLIVVLVLNFSTRRLLLLSAESKAFMGDIYFVICLILGYRIASKLIDLAEDWYHKRVIGIGREEELAPVLTLLVRVSRVVLWIIGITIILDRFGINVTAFAAALGIGGLAFSLAAQNTIRDAIAGFIILVDQPFRIGDRIEIQSVGTWGDVIGIGLRTTRIRTRDNRMVIVPNSIIGENQVINYSYPDPQYRIETHVGVAYGTDIEKARSLIIETVSSLDVVLKDKPVDALYIEMGDSAMIFRVRWWIESFADTRRVVDRVHTALQNAMDEAGIESPYPTQNLHLKIEE